MRLPSRSGPRGRSMWSRHSTSRSIRSRENSGGPEHRLFRRPLDPKRAQAAKEDRQVGALRIVGVRAGDAGRTLFIATDPHPADGQLCPAAGAPLGCNYSAREGAPNRKQPMIFPASNGAGTPRRPMPETILNRRVGGLRSTSETTRRLTKGSRPHEASLAFLGQRRAGSHSLRQAPALPESRRHFDCESTGTIEEATLGESQGEPAARQGP